ncbi:helix-turn-helix transcriptional regulator [Streptomyces sp. NBC_01267]|uniref:helix-turn-helix transcriptional regulator n=1 Tax=unclassified Streptomyces TaxID=2593676 RepID=UPI0022525B12|nr:MULTISPECIES: helix-turn-helix transcriptional regulator [unclassified Streptomyces]MCX4554048.1 helix-turn-helix transcriptional regulator [Streptomyces sp. NBC_01500]WSV52983.1 helix-turn-helix transcriptional regulator [Streptomyces sp. NBC_01014]
MDARTEFRDFLTSRRARITPEQAGLPANGGNRRVTGLRREEVALLAGVSADYYIKLERGNARGVSDSVLEALSRALHLDEAERAHLFDLAAAANSGTQTPTRTPKLRVRPRIQRILDAMSTTPAYVRNRRLDILATNQLGRALLTPILATPHRPSNVARFMFLDPKAADYYLDWERMAAGTVAILRAEAGRDPHDKALIDLVGELATRSDLFRTRWAAHNVLRHHGGVKQISHPVVGELTLGYEALDVAADSGLTIMAYSAEPDTPTSDALNLLASWAVTSDQSGLSI